MTSMAVIDEFLAQRSLAVVGVSRQQRKFGNKVYKDLTAKGYKVFAVNPNAREIDGKPCYPHLKDLPEPVGGVVLVIPPSETSRVAREAVEAGIFRIWMQQGSESREAIEFCEKEGIDVIHGMCIMMFAEPVAHFHRFHRWLWRILGKVPK